MKISIQVAGLVYIYEKFAKTAEWNKLANRAITKPTSPSSPNINVTIFKHSLPSKIYYEASYIVTPPQAPSQLQNVLQPRDGKI